MFRHILIPTDGSSLAGRAFAAGLALARETGARVTGYHALDPMPVRYGASFMVRAGTLRRLEQSQREYARKRLVPLAEAAREAGVPFELVVGAPRSAHEGIVETAKRHHCDTIVMGSHGRSGIGGAILGSVTTQVLARSKIPVVVYR